MKKLLFVTASIVALGAVGPALGADLAPQPEIYTKAPPPRVAATIYDWSGFYIGANGGGWRFNDPNGLTAGGQIGYRQQMGQVVFGLEGQGNWADLNSSDVSATPSVNIARHTDAFGLITGQVGYALNNTLLYVKGGAAVASGSLQPNALTGLQLGGSRFGATALPLGSVDYTRWGATVGTGIEFGFAPNWSVGVEYDHIFMRDENVSFTTPAGAVATDRIRQDFDLLTARLNYKFGGPPVFRY
ncbi:outer membrane protein [Bradyrhizobium sp. STM 3562]|uniref:outer membrane protein n=1 Tax=Bradyrhizobium sp. STM 3562 TaxID=578924 RepID=UPI00388F1B92